MQKQIEKQRQKKEEEKNIRQTEATGGNIAQFQFF